MTAIATATGRIPLPSITVSKTNPRKHFDKAALDELADSIKRHDVLQPILLRPNGGADKYELVAGERRFRAAKLAGLADIPATVRTLTDTEVLEIQVVENLQRSDLHELEEAEGYEQLLKCAHADGKKYNVDEIAAKVGKSRSYVFARLKLCALCPEARKSFYAGELDASRALLIARIGHHDTQRQALKDVTKGRWGNSDGMSYREAHQHILNNYMLALKSAPFDIKDEVLLAKAGACGPCPKRTGNQTDLFGDVKSADVCTDPKCFDDKRQAHYSVTVGELETAGHKVLAGAAAKKILPHWENHRPGNHYLNLAGGYERFEGSTYVNGRSQKISALLGKDFKPTKLQHPLTGEVFEVVTQQAIAAAAKKAEKEKPAKGGSRRKTAAPREQLPDLESVHRKLLFKHICAALPKKLGEQELGWIVGEVMIGDVDCALVDEILLPPAKGLKPGYGVSQKRLEAALPKLDAEGLGKLALALLFSGDNDYGNGQKRLKEALKLYSIDEKAVRAAAQAEVDKASADAKAKPEKAAPKKKAKK